MGIEWIDFMEMTNEIIEALAVNRKGAIDMGIPKEKIDEYIANESERQFAKVESMNTEEFITFMMGRIISKGGVRDLAEMIGEKEEEHK